MSGTYDPLIGKNIYEFHCGICCETIKKDEIALLNVIGCCGNCHIPVCVSCVLKAAEKLAAMGKERTLPKMVDPTQARVEDGR